MGVSSMSKIVSEFGDRSVRVSMGVQSSGVWGHSSLITYNS